MQEKAKENILPRVQLSNIHVAHVPIFKNMHLLCTVWLEKKEHKKRRNWKKVSFPPQTHDSLALTVASQQQQIRPPLGEQGWVPKGGKVGRGPPHTLPPYTHRQTHTLRQCSLLHVGMYCVCVCLFIPACQCMCIHVLMTQSQRCLWGIQAPTQPILAASTSQTFQPNVILVLLDHLLRTLIVKFSPFFKLNLHYRCNSDFKCFKAWKLYTHFTRNTFCIATPSITRQLELFRQEVNDWEM